MRKNTLTLIVFLLVGLLTGSIVAELLSPYPAFSFLTKSSDINWKPKADLNIIAYDLYFEIKLNLASIAGLILSIWIYRKL